MVSAGGDTVPACTAEIIQPLILEHEDALTLPQRVCRSLWKELDEPNLVEVTGSDGI